MIERGRNTEIGIARQSPRHRQGQTWKDYLSEPIRAYRRTGGLGIWELSLLKISRSCDQEKKSIFLAVKPL